MNSWQILGIEPTKEKRKIKRAYAKMLAKYHPEEHPEYFSCIKDAYDFALKYAEWEMAPRSCGQEELETEHSNSPMTINQNSDDSILAPDAMIKKSADAEYQDNVPFNKSLDDEQKVSEAEQRYNSVLMNPCDENSIFVSVEPAEESMENKNLIYTALAELEQAFNYPPNITYQEVYTTNRLRKFVSSELFQSVKEDPFFISGIAELFSSHHPSQEDIIILREAFDLTTARIAYMTYSSELIPILNRFESQLKDKIRRERKFYVRNAFICGFFMLFVLVAIFIQWLDS